MLLSKTGLAGQTLTVRFPIEGTGLFSTLRATIAIDILIQGVRGDAVTLIVSEPRMVDTT